ncbi:hypothetical protein ECANGB1_1509 [Enterospora canceri]|uniref:Uncharacterized protein n=1 Tax=Enterospora canceri TaxID=1081671 RepID=A0A1Y1S734_9MICR|nr:hypothetical protein ECANGB1_1509 [Enterospora canceri]
MAVECVDITVCVTSNLVVEYNLTVMVTVVKELRVLPLPLIFNGNSPQVLNIRSLYSKEVI